MTPPSTNSLIAAEFARVSRDDVRWLGATWPHRWTIERMVPWLNDGGEEIICEGDNPDGCTTCRYADVEAAMARRLISDAVSVALGEEPGSHLDVQCAAHEALQVCDRWHINTYETLIDLLLEYQ